MFWFIQKPRWILINLVWCQNLLDLFIYFCKNPKQAARISSLHVIHQLYAILYYEYIRVYSSISNNYKNYNLILSLTMFVISLPLLLLLFSNEFHKIIEKCWRNSSKYNWDQQFLEYFESIWAKWPNTYVFTTYSTKGQVLWCTVSYLQRMIFCFYLNALFHRRFYTKSFEKIYPQHLIATYILAKYNLHIFFWKIKNLKKNIQLTLVLINLLQ